MCGIVGAVAERNVVPILLEGLRRLEYRGYDSAGLAVVNGEASLSRVRTPGKVARLGELVESTGNVAGATGIAHTRWATHGAPNEANAHPMLADERVAVVHNGIIENHDELRDELVAAGAVFTSDTDTEVVAKLVAGELKAGVDVLDAVRNVLGRLEGAYALGVVDQTDPSRIIGARSGSPLVVGIGVGEHFLASDAGALLPVTQTFMYLDEGDVVEICRDEMTVWDASGQVVEREVRVSELRADAVERGEYRHYMLKEIFEQPRAVADTLEGRVHDGRVLEAAFGPNATAIFDSVEAVQILACGTSYHAGLVARNWFEGLAGVPCNVEVASEFRYRHPVGRRNTLVVTISQSGETADTLSALRFSREQGFGPSLGIVNAPESTLARESDITLMTRAGPEIGVASTKAFTTQLTALLMLCAVIGRRHRLDDAAEARIVEQMLTLPRVLEEAARLDEAILAVSQDFADKHHALFLGRGVQYPVAMEGALKLKEISYIHAEAYPAGELKHGPLALVDGDMPVVVVAPNDKLLEKLKSNMEEVQARGGQLYVFADAESSVNRNNGAKVIDVPHVGDHIAPIVYTVPLQLLAYHVAVLRGTDVDQPRNLAKSVTVE